MGMKTYAWNEVDTLGTLFHSPCFVIKEMETSKYSIRAGLLKPRPFRNAGLCHPHRARNHPLDKSAEEVTEGKGNTGVSNYNYQLH